MYPTQLYRGTVKVVLYCAVTVVLLSLTQPYLFALTTIWIKYLHINTQGRVWRHAGGRACAAEYGQCFQGRLPGPQQGWAHFNLTFWYGGSTSHPIFPHYPLPKLFSTPCSYTNPQCGRPSHCAMLDPNICQHNVCPEKNRTCAEAAHHFLHVIIQPCCSFPSKDDNILVLCLCSVFPPSISEITFVKVPVLIWRWELNIRAIIVKKNRST